MPYDFRTPEQKFSRALQSIITQEFDTATEGGKGRNVWPRTIKAEAEQIRAVVGGVHFVVTIEATTRRS